MFCRAFAGDELVVISPHSDEIKEETARAFAAWHEKHYGTPATIRWREAGGGTSQIIRYLLAEFKSNPAPGIDVLYGGGLPPVVTFEQAGLLTPYTPPADILAAIPAQLNGANLIDPNHEWFATALSGFGILTNQRVREAAGLPEVHTWADLTDPRLAGWISASDPRASGSALAIYEIILQAYGWDKGWAVLTEMSGNIRNFLSSSAASVVEVGTGDAAYGVAIDQYGQAQVGYYGKENVTFTLPEGQTVITPDCIAILKNAPHLELAQQFVDFVLSRDGQLLWMQPRGAPGGAVKYRINRMSVMPALYDELRDSPITTNPFKLSSSFKYSNELDAKRHAILAPLIAAWLIDTHDWLAKAWLAVNSPAAQKLGEARQQALIAQLTAPPCSQDELLRLAAGDFKDPVKRTAIINQWQAEAIARYKSVLAQTPGN
ncbi:MAG TPA: extracellular solute-binding protein [Candidatus Methylacidiphilales bacterium]|jgi:ABC-type Fe3+ transport system substrate-binding protein|nr:extracellular solute-binding protein [Candidatus Methylacidiphilales bacterium]